MLKDEQASLAEQLVLIKKRKQLLEDGLLEMLMDIFPETQLSDQVGEECYDELALKLVQNDYRTTKFSMNPKYQNLIRKDSFYLLAKNPNLTMKILKSFSFLGFSVQNLLENPNLPFPFLMSLRQLRSYKSHSDWMLSQNSALTAEVIRAYPHIEWDGMKVSRYAPYLTIPQLESLGLFDIKQIVFSENWHLKFEDVMRYAEDYPYALAYFTRHQNCDLETYKRILEFNLGLEEFAANRNATRQVIEDNPQIRWNLILIFMNPNLTLQDYKEMQDRFPLNYDLLSFHPRVTWKDIDEHPGVPWDPIGLSRNPNTTWAEVKARPGIPWDMNAFFANGQDRLQLNRLEKMISEKLDNLSK